MPLDFGTLKTSKKGTKKASNPIKEEFKAKLTKNKIKRQLQI